MEEPALEGSIDYLLHLEEALQEDEALANAKAQLEASRDSKIPAPRFGTLERAVYDNERRIRSEQGIPQISKATFEQTLRNKIRSIQNG